MPWALPTSSHFWADRPTSGGRFHNPSKLGSGISNLLQVYGRGFGSLCPLSYFQLAHVFAQIRQIPEVVFAN
jgi:hypothetical protein